MWRFCWFGNKGGHSMTFFFPKKADVSWRQNNMNQQWSTFWTILYGISDMHIFIAWPTRVTQNTHTLIDLNLVTRDVSVFDSGVLDVHQILFCDHTLFMLKILIILTVLTITKFCFIKMRIFFYKQDVIDIIIVTDINHSSKQNCGARLYYSLNA